MVRGERASEDRYPQMHHYNLDEIFCLFAQSGVRAVYGVPTNDEGVLGWHLHFRKGPPAGAADPVALTASFRR
jgi:hypothetical protein